MFPGKWQLPPSQSHLVFDILSPTPFSCIWLHIGKGQILYFRYQCAHKSWQSKKKLSLEENKQKWRPTLIPPALWHVWLISHIEVPQNRAKKMNSISWEEFDSPKSLPQRQENQEVAQEGIIQKQIKLAMKFAHIIRKPADFPPN